MNCNVIATFNTIGNVKPIYVSFDDASHKISKIMTTQNEKDYTRFWCYFESNDKLIALCFDGINWWIE